MPSRSPSPTSSISDTELLDTFETQAESSGFNYSDFRERRLAELQEQVAQQKSREEERLGNYTEVKVEKDLIAMSAREPFTLIHFYLPDFARCRIMHDHLSSLAPKHPHTLFLRASVANTPFLVHRLGVKVLPCVIAFVDGEAVDRIVGFEELGNTDEFTSAILEFRLKKSGVLPPPGYRPPNPLNLLKVRASGSQDDKHVRSIRDSAIKATSDDDEWD